MPPTFQQITNLPNDRYQVVHKPTSADNWTNAQVPVHTSLEEATTYAMGLVQAPTNSYQSMVLAPAVAFQKSA